MSSLLLAVHSYPDANDRVKDFFPYYENTGADMIFGVGTTDGRCKWPRVGGDTFATVDIGRNAYIEGDHLPRRLVDTMRLMLLLPYDRYCVSEWDCLFFKPMPEFSGMVGFHAGNQLPGMRAQKFYHWPLGFDAETGRKFVKKADELMPQVSAHECSPDVFFGWVCQEAGIEVTQPWIGYTRNTIESEQDEAQAREAYQNGAMAVHGVKSMRTLARILS